MTENYPSGEKHGKSSDRNSMNTTHHCQGKSTHQQTDELIMRAYTSLCCTMKIRPARKDDILRNRYF